MWNPDDLTDPDLLVADLRASRERVGQYQPSSPRLDADALADVCEFVDEVAAPLEAANIVGMVAEATGNAALSQRLLREVTELDEVLWGTVAGPWMRMVQGLDDRTFAELTSHPRLASRAAALDRARHEAPPVPPHPHHGQLSRRLAPQMPAMFGTTDQAAGAAAEVIAALGEEADRTAAAYQQVLRMALGAGSASRLVAAVTDVDDQLWTQVCGAYDDAQGQAHELAARRSSLVNAPLSMATRLAAPEGSSTSYEVADQIGLTRDAARLLGDPASAALEELLAAPTRLWFAPRAPGPQCLVTPPGMLPLVAVPFNGTTATASGVVHELFHAVHRMLADPALPPPAVRAPVTIAEGHAHLGEVLAASLSGDQLRLLDLTLTGAWRQAVAARFERRALEHVAAGGQLAAEQLAQWWLQEQSWALGDAFAPLDGEGHAWALVGHLWKRPGLVTAYAAGAAISAPTAAALVGGQDADAASRRWLEMLSRGGEPSLQRAAQMVGADRQAMAQGLAHPLA